jgi:hypothetical protein
MKCSDALVACCQRGKGQGRGLITESQDKQKWPIHGVQIKLNFSDLMGLIHYLFHVIILRRPSMTTCPSY